MAAVSAWLMGEPLFPDVFHSYAGPECSEPGVCMDPARVILFSFLFHVLQFVGFYFALKPFAFYAKLSISNQITLVSYIVSTFHAAFTALGSLQHVFMADIPVTESYFVLSPEIQFYVAYCSGYFIYDFLLIHIFYSSFWSPAIFLHHLIGALVFPATFVYSAGTFMVGFFLIMEGSTPFVNMRWILSALGYKTTQLYSINALLMLVVFFLVRPCVLVYFAYRMYVCEDDISQLSLPFLSVMWLSAFAGAGLNIYWFYKILTGALSLLIGSKGKDASSKSKKQ